MPAETAPLVSVVVPTKDRPRALERCLAALAAQTLAERLEIVVVDDGSLATHDIERIVSKHTSARLLRGSGGPAAARNNGAGVAAGSFLCFTDDDCEPEPEWAERLVACLENGADAAAGVTLAGAGALAAASELTAHAPAAVPFSGESDLAFAPSNNLACTREAFTATPFDESYPGAAGEDRDWCARLVAGGYVLRSAPAARLVHHQELTFDRFLRQQARYGRAAFQYRRAPTRRPLEPPGFYVRLLRRAFGQGATVGILVCVAQVATAIGYLDGWLAGRKSRRDAPPRSERQPPM